MIKKKVTKVGLILLCNVIHKREFLKIINKAYIFGIGAGAQHLYWGIPTKLSKLTILARKQ